MMRTLARKYTSSTTKDIVRKEIKLRLATFRKTIEDMAFLLRKFMTFMFF